MTQTILIADDDTELCELLCEYLGQEGFEVRLAHDGEQALVESRRPGLDADDYLAKPANPRDLLARIRAILRRSNAHSSIATLEIGDLVLNQGGRELRRGGQLMDLTSTEFSIIQLLLQRSGRGRFSLEI